MGLALLLSEETGSSKQFWGFNLSGSQKLLYNLVELLKQKQKAKKVTHKKKKFTKSE